MTREEAISWLVSLTEHEGEDIPIYDTDVEALNMAIKALEQEPRWVPVTERLPEESDDYLVTNGDVDVETAYFAHPKDYAISNGEWREIWYEDDVIAWMPLPQPYKAGSEGKNENKYIQS